MQRILYQTVNNDGDEDSKKILGRTADRKDGANSNGQISTYTVNGQTLEEVWTESAVFDL